MIRTLIFTATLVLWALPGSAEVSPRLQKMFSAIDLSGTIDIMRQEGLDYGQSLRDEMFPNSGGSGWGRSVDKIYDDKWMSQIVQEGMAKSLTQGDIDPVIAFFETDLGARIIRLELSARRALFDKDVEEASKQRFKDMAQELDPRVTLLEQFVEANNLIDENVAGAMNSNLAFYRGLRDGGAKGFDLGEAQMLEDVWSQEIQIRVDTSEWVYGYVSMAYTPLEDGDLQAYVDFSKTKPGQALNKALFGAFDTMFVEISYKLGKAAARYLSGEDI